MFPIWARKLKKKILFIKIEKEIRDGKRERGERERERDIHTNTHTYIEIQIQRALKIVARKLNTRKDNIFSERER